MEFDSKSQKMKCPFCDTVVDMAEFEEADAGNKAKQNKQEGNAAEGDQGAEGKPEGQMMLYVCESCGGEILAEKTTGATSCPYCGNKVVMKGQFDGALQPDCIIPFK